MAFPQTRQTLIHRLATGGSQSDWQTFVVDYWGPVYRFARRRGQLGNEDAEDVAAAVFEVIVAGDLLARWSRAPAAKLRTLLCAIISNVLSNRARVLSGRARLITERAPFMLDAEALSLLGAVDVDHVEAGDAVYADWVDELLYKAIESLMAMYHAEGRGDVFRVLYGRICEKMTSAEIAEALETPLHTVENHYKHARTRLAALLDEYVRRDVEEYSPADETDAEFAAEWRRLGTYLSDHGGLENAIARCYESSAVMEDRRRQKNALSKTMFRLARKAAPSP